MHFMPMAIIQVYLLLLVWKVCLVIFIITTNLLMNLYLLNYAINCTQLFNNWIGTAPLLLNLKLLQYLLLCIFQNMLILQSLKLVWAEGRIQRIVSGPFSPL